MRQSRHPSRRTFLGLAALGLAARPAAAHHGWGSYDTARAFTLTGPIVKSAYENPHCEIDVQAENKIWRFVLAPPFRMQNRGITAEMIKPGTTCSVHGYPHTSDPDEARIEYIVLAGKRYELR
jgi:hypothetical protein